MFEGYPVARTGCSLSQASEPGPNWHTAAPMAPSVRLLLGCSCFGPRSSAPAVAYDDDSPDHSADAAPKAHLRSISLKQEALGADRLRQTRPAGHSAFDGGAVSSKGGPGVAPAGSGRLTVSSGVQCMSLIHQWQQKGQEGPGWRQHSWGLELGGSNSLSCHSLVLSCMWQQRAPLTSPFPMHTCLVACRAGPMLP